MNNFWAYIIAGMTALLQNFLSALPHHQNIGFDGLFTDLLGSTPIFLFLVINEFVNLYVPMSLFSLIFFLEGIRSIYAAYMWIKSALPFAG